MDRFYELLHSSVIISGIIALALVFTVCYLAVVGQEIPDVVQAGLMAVLGFFFGAKGKQDNQKGA